MGMVYQYFSAPRFRCPIEAIVEKFTDMQEVWTKNASP